jgi:hypothetical protein
LGRSLARYFLSAPRHEINLADFDSLTKSFQCSLSDLQTALEILSHPEVGFFERSFVRGDWPNRTALEAEEVV